MIRFRHVCCEFCEHEFTSQISKTKYLVCHKEAYKDVCPSCGEELFIFEDDPLGRLCAFYNVDDIHQTSISLD